MLFHKRDEHAVDGWDAEDHPTVGQDRADQRRGEGVAGGDLVEQRAVERTRRRRAGRARRASRTRRAVAASATTR